MGSFLIKSFQLRMDKKLKLSGLVLAKEHAKERDSLIFQHF